MAKINDIETRGEGKPSLPDPKPVIQIPNKGEGDKITSNGEKNG